MPQRRRTQRISLLLDVPETVTYPPILSQFADYPAIVPSERSEALFGRELTPDESSVRGTLVTGLTAMDIAFLDVFEGNARISFSF
jgi:hypothetical protein